MSSHRRGSLTVLDGAAYFTSSNKPKKFLNLYKRDKLFPESPQAELKSPQYKHGNKDQSYLFRKFLTLSKDSLPRLKRDYQNSSTPSPLESVKIQEKIERTILKNRVKQSMSHLKLTPEALDRNLKEFNEANRHGALNLKLWIDFMINAIKERNIPDSEDSLLMVYSTAMREMIRQVSTACNERGMVLFEITSMLGNLWKDKMFNIKKLLEKDLNQKALEISKIKEQNAIIVSQLESNVNTLTTHIEALEEKNNNLENEKFDLQIHVKQLETLINVQKAKKFTDFSQQLSAKMLDNIIQTDKLFELSVTETQNTEILAKSMPELEIDKIDFHFEDILNHLLTKETVDQEEIDHLLTSSSSDFQLGFSASSQLYMKRQMESVGVGTEDMISLSIPDKDSQFLNVESLELQATPKDKDLNSSVSSIEELSPQLSRSRNIGKSFKKAVTKIIEFQFARRKSFSGLRTQPSILKLITQFISQPDSKIQKHANLSRHNLIKHICSLFSATRSKMKHLENSPSIPMFIFDELTLKYSIPELAKRKYKEIIASSTLYYDNKKIRLFLRAAGAGSLIYERDLSHEGCLICVNCYQFLLNGNNETMCSFTKAQECLKEFVEGLINKAEFQELIGIIDSKCTEDPHKLTKIGHIEIDLMIETAVNYYEQCRENILEGIKIVCCDFFGTQLHIKKEEFWCVIRSIYPSENFEKVKEEIEKIFEDYAEELTYNPDYYYSCDVVKRFCIRRKMLSASDIENFVKVEQFGDLNAIQTLVEFVDNNYAFLGEYLQEKVSNFYGFVEEGNLHAAVFLFRIFKAELNNRSL